MKTDIELLSEAYLNEVWFKRKKVKKPINKKEIVNKIENQLKSARYSAQNKAPSQDNGTNAGRPIGGNL